MQYAGQDDYDMQVRWLELEAVTEFGEDLARVVGVESSEGEGVVEQHVAVGDVGRSDGRGDVFAEAFADGEVERGVRGQVGIWVWRWRVLRWSWSTGE